MIKISEFIKDKRFIKLAACVSGLVLASAGVVFAAFNSPEYVSGYKASDNAAGHSEDMTGKAAWYGGVYDVMFPKEAGDEDYYISKLDKSDEAAEYEYSEYANLAVAQVDNYVNVRAGAGTDFEIVGKMYDGSVAEIIDSVDTDDGLWFHVESGSVTGYIKAEYFVYGEELISDIEKYIKRYAVVQVSLLNIRSEADVESDRVSYATSGEKLLLADGADAAPIVSADGMNWLRVNYSEDNTGYVAEEYVFIEEEYISAKSIEEEQAEIQARREQEERAREERLNAQNANGVAKGNVNADKAEDTTVTVVTAADNYSTNSELRSAIIDYALQYVGTRYVHGGQSLSGGTDCSGFTCYVYREFGYSLSRTPSGQYSSAGRSVSLDSIQPGDIICYGSGSCTHVGLYMGGGQIVHEANAKKGCIVSDISFMNILGARNVID